MSVPLPRCVRFVQITGQEMSQTRESIVTKAYSQLKFVVMSWLLVEIRASLGPHMIMQTLLHVNLLVTKS